MTGLRVGFCVSGVGLLFRTAVQRRAELGIDPVLLVARPNAAQDLEQFCALHGVPMVRLAKMPREEFNETLSRVCIDAHADLFSLSFDRIIPPDLVRCYRQRMINVHPSLLPAFPGTSGTADTLARGARFGGATIHEVVDEVDAGPIVAQCVLATIPGESLDAFRLRLFVYLEPMYLQVLKWYAEGRVGHDEAGRVVVRDARYGELPVAPSLESF
ncbi:MAG TPA: formyltransferase family protein [Thermoanaerobaculia bacterium]|nr:formyltransferase family protein [Thermoanaerobaculia bacterium]